jgi:hypothetical protein
MNASAREPCEPPATPAAPTRSAQEAGRQRLAELIGRLLAQRWLKTQPTASHGDTAGTPTARTNDR